MKPRKVPKHSKNARLHVRVMRARRVTEEMNWPERFAWCGKVRAESSEGIGRCRRLRLHPLGEAGKRLGIKTTFVRPQLPRLTVPIPQHEANL